MTEHQMYQLTNDDVREAAREAIKQDVPVKLGMSDGVASFYKDVFNDVFLSDQFVVKVRDRLDTTEARRFYDCLFDVWDRKQQKRLAEK